MKVRPTKKQASNRVIDTVAWYMLFVVDFSFKWLGMASNSSALDGKGLFFTMAIPLVPPKLDISV